MTEREFLRVLTGGEACSSIGVSYAIALVQWVCVIVAYVRVDAFVPCLLVALVATLPQARLLNGVLKTKGHELLPRKVGHGSAFASPDALAHLGWFRVLAGFIASGFSLLAFYVLSRA